jgi:xylulokinase
MPFLGIDVSTTGAKALVIDERGNVLGKGTSEYPLSTPRPLWSEQDPTSWWAGTVRSIRAALEGANLSGGQIEAVGLTGQMHGLVLLDSSGSVLRPAILWNDQRTSKQCEEITDRVGLDRLLSVSGNPALTGFTAPKVLWVREHEPEVYAKAAQILLPKDYVRYRLTDQYASDKAGAAGTLLFDLKRRDWSVEILDALEIPPDWLPETYEGPDTTGTVTEAAAEATGLAPGVPVVAGGGDQAAQAVGVGAVGSGILALTLGTSGVVFAPVGEPMIEPEGRLHAFCHAMPPGADSGWHLMGVMLSAAGSLRWYRDTLAPEKAYDELTALAADVQPGAEGLFFLPYLTGERTPHPDPLARGAFVGLTLRHTRDHMTRAVMEGVGFGLRDSMELMKQVGLGQVDQVRISGGGSRSALWQQILSDILNSPLARVNVTEGASYGAAILAGVGAGAWPTVPAACQETIEVVDTTDPRPDEAACYDRLYPEYQALYPRLKSTFRAVARME